MKINYLRWLIGLAAVALVMLASALRAQTALYFPVYSMTGGTNDVTLNIQAANNPTIWNGNFYWLPANGTNITSTNGIAYITLVPGQYTASILGLPQSWSFTVTNSPNLLNATTLPTTVTQFTGVQSLVGAGGIQVTQSFPGVFTITSTGMNGSPASAYMQGYMSNVVSQINVPNTNDVFASVAGTSLANGHYHLWQNLNGFIIYSNIVTSGGASVGYVGQDFAGTFGPNGDQHPFFMGPTTNNVCTDSSPTPSCWYFSALAMTAYWTNADDLNTGSGANPPPLVSFGTNEVLVTNSVFISPAWYASQFTNGIIHVTQTGNDILASNLLCAFATCKAAKNFAQAGDLIEVDPGWYEGHDLLKGYVNWKFEQGSTIAWDEPQLGMNPVRGIFDDWAGAVTSTITGDRIHWTDVWPNNGDAIVVTNAGTDIRMTFNAGDGANYMPFGNFMAVPGWQRGLNAPGFFVLDANDNYTDFKFNTLSGGTNSPHQLLDGDDLDGYALSGPGGTYGTFRSVTNDDMGFYWGNGEEHVFVHNYVNTNNYELVPPPSVAQYSIWPNDNAINESSFFFTADHVTTLVYYYDSSDDPNARVWLNIGYFDGLGGALSLYGNDLVYYEGEKISAGGVTPVVTVPNLAANTLWLTVQKMTQNGSAPWMTLAGSNTDYINVQYFEDNDPDQMPDGIVISGNSTNYFTGGKMSISTNSPFVISGAGKTSLIGMILNAVGTNQDIQLSDTNGLSLEGDILHTASAAESILATKTGWVNGSWQADVSPTNVIGSWNIGGINYGAFSGNGGSATNLQTTNLVLNAGVWPPVVVPGSTNLENVSTVYVTNANNFAGEFSFQAMITTTSATQQSLSNYCTFQFGPLPYIKNWSLTYGPGTTALWANSTFIITSETSSNVIVGTDGSAPGTLKNFLLILK